MNIALREAFVEIFDGKNLLEDFKKEVELQVPKKLRHKKSHHYQNKVSCL